MRGMWLLAAGVAVVLAGCAGDPYWVSLRSKEFVKPSIAVHSFTNRATPPAQWSLGDGMQELLINALLKTERFHVAERESLGDIVSEIRVEQSPGFRPEGRAPVGRLMNVQYLVKGTIIDFDQISAARFGAGQAEIGRAFLGYKDEKAVITINLYVIEVASGRVVASEVISEQVDARQVAAEIGYKSIGFGGSVFWKTPLGEACSRVIQRAVVRITDAVAAQRWEPKIAKVLDGVLVLNGGADRDLRVGTTYLVLGAPERILDPDNGEVIGYLPGAPVGRAVITQVQPACSIARIVEGAGFQVGQQLAQATGAPIRQAAMTGP
jgi:curli biogenesis system outer membrane secretion channel CsgG